MYVGASTANFYPMLTEESLDLLIKEGFENLEVFINTQSEASPEFAAELRKRADRAGARVRSLHSYLSGTEPYLLFSAYHRRFQDGLQLYREIFQAAKVMGAAFVILHGDRREGVLSVEESIARFETVYDLGQEYGVTLLQENVVHFRASDQEYIRAMKRQLGSKAHFVLDLKQSLRSGDSPMEMLRCMGRSVAHIHISDHDDSRDCLVPGQGKTDFRELIQELNRLEYDGGLILELYRNNFQTAQELSDGKQFLLRLFN